MTKQDIAVQVLVDMIRRGELRLPVMQRRYVWRAPRVRDLLDSLYRGYPTGSILVWQSDTPRPTRDLAVPQQSSPFAGHKLLLDGQQRLTSLAAVTWGEQVAVRGRKRPIDILFNLEHPDGPPREFTEVLADEESPLLEEDETDIEGEDDEGNGDSTALQERLNQRTFVVASKALAALPHWVSVSQVFASDGDGPLLRKAGVTSLDDPRYSKYTARLQRLRKIRDYPYVMYVLDRDLAYEEVAEIFVRVNSLGMKLRGSDLALAQITARWPNSLQLLEEFQEECERTWFTLDLGLLVRMMVTFASQQCRFRTVGGIPTERLQEGWEQAKDGLRYAINFMRANAEIEDESLLSSPFLFAPIAVFSQLRSNNISRDEERAMLYWLHVANARGRYSRGSSESLLDEDLSILFKKGSPQDLLNPMRAQFGRLHIEPSDLAGRGTRSPLFSLAFLALRAAGAKDWGSMLGISLAHQGKLHFIEHHHIFAKALLKEAQYEKAETNEIANMAFVGRAIHSTLGKTPPSVYFPQIIARHGSDGPLRSQVIPMDPALHLVENYRMFLEARRVALAKAINDHMLAALNGERPHA